MLPLYLTESITYLGREEKKKKGKKGKKERKKKLKKLKKNQRKPTLCQYP